MLEDILCEIGDKMHAYHAELHETTIFIDRKQSNIGKLI